jgi:hypothetical protein
MAGKRARAFEDLRSDSGRRESGIKPGLLQSLFSGGVSKGSASADLREGRAPARPSSRQSLFAGGKARSLASENLIMGAPGEGSDRPGNLQPLADGGEVGDDGADVGDGLIIAAEDIMDCLGSYFGASPSDSDSKVEKATKEASRRARAKILAQALKSFFMQLDSEPHDEG